MPDFETNMKIICLESKAFKALVSEVADQLKGEFFEHLNPWVDEKEAMQLLRIHSKATSKKYREEGNITYSTISNKKMLYDRQSILDFIVSRKNK